MKLSDLNKDGSHFFPQRVAVVGLPGSGKTTLVAALAEAGFKLHWIDTDHGVETLMKLSPAAQDNINLIQLPDSATYPIAADTLASLFKAGAGKICTAHGKFNCALCAKSAPETMEAIDFHAMTHNEIVIVDSATQWSNSILAHIMRTRPVDAKPERDDWGALRKHTEFALSQMQAMPCHFIAIFHAQEAEMEDGKKKLVPTFGSASMSTEVAKAFGHVIYTEVKNRRHVAYSSSIALPNVLTKSRTDFEIEALPTPSLVPIFTSTAVEAKTPDTPKEIALRSNPAQQALANLKQGIKQS